MVNGPLLLELQQEVAKSLERECNFSKRKRKRKEIESVRSEFVRATFRFGEIWFRKCVGFKIVRVSKVDYLGNETLRRKIMFHVFDSFFFLHGIISYNKERALVARYQSRLSRTRRSRKYKFRSTFSVYPYSKESVTFDTYRAFHDTVCNLS